MLYLFISILIVQPLLNFIIMKKRVLLIAFVAMANVALAQGHYGIIAGPNFATIGPEQSGFSFSEKVGFYGGVWADYPLCHHFDIEPELLYSGEGYKVTSTSSLGTYSSSTSENYLNIPILARYNCHSGFYGVAGPQVGLLLSANSGGVDVKSSYTSAEISGVIGVGYISPYNVGVQLKYNYGFTGLEKDYMSTSGFPDYKNRVIQFGVFYKVK